MEDLLPHAQSHLSRFGLTSFRPGQGDVISAVLEGNDCLCIMPTGGGKSLCYQLPAIARQGLTIVVSPLIALMKDQVDVLQARGIAATFINSSLTPNEQRQRMDAMGAGEYDLVYVAPERLRHLQFIEKLRQTKLQLLAVDEAHCISEWGHDFRPDYARLGKFRERLGFPQTIALTATATPKVRSDVVKQLQLREPKIFITGFARENLHFESVQAANEKDKLELLREFLRQNAGSGIIYAATRKRCEELVESLKKLVKRKAAVYHAGLTPDQRRAVQDEFMNDRLPIIVATNAFGMGIDKRDLRFVVHYNMPGSLEAYYQEAGRAGRDGLPSRCLLIYSYPDRIIQEFFIDSRFPPREVVQQVYDHLRRKKEDPLELTLQELKDELGLKSVSSEAIGASEKMLETCGALERLDSKQNMAAVRIDSDLPTLVDLLPVEAKVQRKVLRAVEKLGGEMRQERFFVSPDSLARMTDLEPASISRALKELSKLKAFDYVPPFRGRAIHMIERKKAFKDLGIDFAELDRRLKAEYEKLDAVLRYAETSRCRQVEILDYFGDPSRKECRLCDNCGGLANLPAQPSGGDDLPTPAKQPAPSAAKQALDIPPQTELARRVLAGVARCEGRFGKTIVAKMLCGSQASDVERARLNRLSTFGLLSHFQQIEITAVIDALLSRRYLQQVEEQKFRPLIRLTPMGEQLMRGQEALSQPLYLDDLLAAKIRQFIGKGQPAPAMEVEKSLAKEPVSRPVPPPDSNFSSSIEPESFSCFPDEAEVQTYAPPPSAMQVFQESRPDTSQRFELAAEPEEPAAPLPAIKTASKIPITKPDHYWTWRLFTAGFSAAEIGKIRHLQEGVIYDHVLKAARDGLAIEAAWLLAPDQMERLQVLVGDGSPERIRPLLAGLPEGLKYRDVQLYLLSQKKASSPPASGPSEFS